MQVEVSWDGGVSFAASNANNNKVMMDGPENKGGQNKGPRPMELLLMGLGGCTSYDVVGILQKSQQSLVHCVAHIKAERADTTPSVFTHIHVHFVVTGDQLKESLVARAIDLSAQKYCSASIMLGQAGVKITHDYELVDTANPS